MTFKPSRSEIVEAVVRNVPIGTVQVLKGDIAWEVPDRVLVSEWSLLPIVRPRRGGTVYPPRRLATEFGNRRDFVLFRLLLGETTYRQQGGVLVLRVLGEPGEIRTKLPTSAPVPLRAPEARPVRVVEYPETSGPF